jgi:acetyl esterase
MLVHDRTTARRRLGDRLQRGVVRALAALPPSAQVRLSGGRPVQVDGQTLNPELQLLLSLRERRGVRPFDGMTPQQARRYVRREARAAQGRPTPVGAVREVEVTGAAGPLRARHYAPDEPGGPHPLLLYLHGGGFVVGDIETYDEPCRVLCRHAGAHVLSVEYRLAPEDPFPAAADDAIAALDWALDHAGELGADPERVAVGGDSAGGNLAAVASRHADRRPALQLLIYPAADMDTERASHALFAEGFYLTAADRLWYHRQYFSGFGGPDNPDPRARSLLDGELGGLPPAFVVTAAFDPLRDEGEAYAEALRAAGTPVLLRRFDGLIHGFINMGGISPACRDALVEIAGTLRGMLRANDLEGGR